MNKCWLVTVLVTVRNLPLLLFFLIAPFLGSCSTSRLVDSDRVLDPGDHIIRSVIDSDILIPSGSSLRVDYTAGNRFFVQSGGTLSGLSKGAQRSSIYAEPGALVPALSQKTHVRVVEVEDAEDTFRDRFKKLLPANAPQNSGASTVAGGAIYTGGYYGHHHHRRHYSGGSSHRPQGVTVRPDSYRSRN